MKNKNSWEKNQFLWSVVPDFRQVFCFPKITKKENLWLSPHKQKR